MCTEALLSFGVESGTEVIDALDQGGRTPDVALWAKLPDYEELRLVIASDRPNQESSLSGYEQINDAMKKASLTDRLRPATSDTCGMSLGGQKFGGKHLEDAFVYRIR